MKTFLAIVLIAAVFVPAKLKLESSVAREHMADESLQPALDLSERLGQNAFIAILGGFRSVVADFLFIDAEVAWENTDWPHLLLRLRQVTTLQPHVPMFWDTAGWHMAWNAGTAALRDESKPLALRKRIHAEYIELGRDFLQHGVANNPRSAQLYEALARLYRDKLHDHARAAENFAKAAQLPGAAAYDERFGAYELSQCPGREREAYEKLRELYDRGEKERLPTLIKRLKFLEEKLSIPAEQRVEAVKS